MANDTVYSKARLLFLAFLCAGGIAALVWKIWSDSNYRTYQIETRDPVSGLIVDAPVELHGVEVGKVTNIQLLDAGTVQVRLSLAKSTPISTATVATITSRGLAARGFAGYVYIALENSAADSGPLLHKPGQPYLLIPTARSRIVTIDTVAAEITDKVEEITGLLHQVLDEQTIVSLKRTVAALEEITRILQPVLDEKTVASLHQSADALQEITRLLLSVLDPKTVASLRRSADGLSQIMTTLAANDKRIESLILNAERDSRDLRPLVETSNATVRELNTRVLPQFYRTVGDLQDLTRTMNEMANRLARDPSAMLRGTVTPPGPGER
jgi:phospholipid/cholesterol/gamma-HCH transport system substrate-binding protein